jgi:hypothetical protein
VVKEYDLIYAIRKMLIGVPLMRDRNNWLVCPMTSGWTNGLGVGQNFFAHDGFVYGLQETTGLNILSTAILLSGSNKYINIDSVIGASAGNWFVRLVDVSRRVVALGVIRDAKTVAPISHVI